MMSTVQKLILFGEFSRGICLQSDAASKDGGVEVTDVLLKDKLVANGIHTNITDPNTPINFSYVRKWGFAMAATACATYYPDRKEKAIDFPLEGEAGKHMLEEHRFGSCTCCCGTSGCIFPPVTKFLVSDDQSVQQSKRLVITARGTDGRKQNDWANIQAWGWWLNWDAGRVHAGWLRLANKAYYPIKRKIEEYMDGDQLKDGVDELMITAHSLGAGLCTIIATRLAKDYPKLKEKMTIWMFGLPTFVSKNFVKYYDKMGLDQRTVLVLHQNDRKAAQLQRIACWTRNNGCITVSPAMLEDGPGDKGSIPQKDIGEFQYSDDYYKDSSKKDKYGNVTHNKRVYVNTMRLLHWGADQEGLGDKWAQQCMKDYEAKYDKDRVLQYDIDNGLSK